MTARDEIAEAVTAVPGVNVTSTYRQTTKPGDGWVSFAGLTRDESGFSFMDEWEVRIVTHTDLAASDQWIEDNSPAILDALRPVLIVTSMVAVTFQADQGNIPGLLISGVRPHPEGTEAR